MPEGAELLTAGFDVQKDRLVYVIRGWGGHTDFRHVDAMVQLADETVQPGAAVFVFDAGGDCEDNRSHAPTSDHHQGPCCAQGGVGNNTSGNPQTGHAAGAHRPDSNREARKTYTVAHPFGQAEAADRSV